MSSKHLNVLLRFCLLYCFVFHIHVPVITCHVNVFFYIKGGKCDIV